MGWRRRIVSDASPADADEVAVEELARALDLEVDLSSLRSLAVRRIQALSGCHDVLFYAPRASPATYECLSSAIGQTTGLRTPPLRAPGPLIHWLRANDEPLVVSSKGEVVEYLASEEQEFLRALGVQVCLPLTASEELLAVLFLASSDLEWRPLPSMPLLTACGRRVALALDRLRWHQLERDRLEATARAQQLAMAGELAAALAHEVRNPLTAIRSTVQYVMQSTPDWPRKTDLLNTVLSDIDRIADTISGLLRLSRKHDLQMVDLDWVQLAERTLIAAMPHLRDRHVTLERHWSHPCLPIRGDAGELGQVLMNLLLNACQALTAGGHISLDADIGLHGSPTGPMPNARLVIADNGPGIPAEQLHRVFEPFYTTKATGTGLGLPICWEIMTRHLGSIRIESHVGIGTTVVLTLPLRVA